MELKGQIVIYTQTGCKESVTTLTKFESLLLPYTEVNLTEDSRRWEEMVKRSKGGEETPQVFFNNMHVGGYNELIELETSGQLDALIEMVKNESPPSSVRHSDTDNGDLSLEEVLSDMMSAGLLSTNRTFLSQHSNSFSGRQLVVWLTEKRGQSYEDALHTGSELIQQGFILHVSDHSHPFTDSAQLYKLVGTAHPSALNTGLYSAAPHMTGVEIGEALRKSITGLFGKHVREDGRSVDYTGLKSDVDFAKYVMLSKHLQRAHIGPLTKNEKISMFINVYNSLVIHGIVTKGNPSSMWSKYQFFSKVSYIIDGLLYSLNEIENGILRANRKPIAALTRPFSSSDRRLQHALMEPEPRIHFALNCGAKGCPPIRVYSAQQLDTQLTRATKSFLCTGGCVIKGNEVSLTELFKWYRDDFGTNNHQMLKWIADYLGTAEKELLQELIDTRSYKITWQDYDWSLNH